jgi:hypothetical protein
VCDPLEYHCHQSEMGFFVVLCCVFVLLSDFWPLFARSFALVLGEVLSTRERLVVFDVCGCCCLCLNLCLFTISKRGLNVSLFVGEARN